MYKRQDSYEWFGGNVNCKYLVAYNGWDDEFDTDTGFSGKVQYCLSIRDPRIEDTSQSNGFESDTCGDASLIEPYTTCLLYTSIIQLRRWNNIERESTRIGF